jgi:N-acetylglucosamine-6-phosphate deacetylase
MPSFKASNGITKFTNCRLVRGESLVWHDLWVSSATGKIIDSQVAFYDELVVPDTVVDLGGRIISPGLIECQLNGAFGFNFSECPGSVEEYQKRLKALNRDLVRTGITSYVPTITSQLPHLYKKVCSRDNAAAAGQQSLKTARFFLSSARPDTCRLPKTAPNPSEPTSRAPF